MSSENDILTQFMKSQLYELAMGIDVLDGHLSIASIGIMLEGQPVMLTFARGREACERVDKKLKELCDETDPTSILSATRVRREIPPENE